MITHCIHLQIFTTLCLQLKAGICLDDEQEIEATVFVGKVPSVHGGWERKNRMGKNCNFR